MAKKIYIGVNDTARAVKKVYVGIDGVARKVKKAYIGVGGVARPFWTGGELTFYGFATDLSEAKYNLAAASVGDYALFAGGVLASSDPVNDFYDGKCTKVVDAYDKSLTRTNPTTLYRPRFNMAATSVGNYAFFGGGQATSYYSGEYTSDMDIYDTTLTQTAIASLDFNEARYNLAAASVGDYAIFAGGSNSGGGRLSSAYAYSTSLTKSTPSSLSSSRTNLSAASVGNYALFAGGSDTANYNNPMSTTVDTYNTSLTRSTARSLTTGRS